MGSSLLVLSVALLQTVLSSLLPPCRRLLGRYYYLTVIFVPAVLCSIPAILVERKERRGSLAMYLLTLVSGEERKGNVGCMMFLSP